MTIDYEENKESLFPRIAEQEIVTISKERYEELLESERTLLALEAGGVSSWKWYEQSLEDYEDENKSKEDQTQE